MKFGKRLSDEILEEWREHYIPYERLKEIIYKVDENCANEKSQEFFELLNETIEKLNIFCKGEVIYLQDKLKNTLIGDRSEIIHKFDLLMEEFVKLKDFIEINFTGIRKIVKKFDKVTKIKNQNFVELVKQENFYKKGLQQMNKNIALLKRFQEYVQNSFIEKQEKIFPENITIEKLDNMILEDKIITFEKILLKEIQESIIVAPESSQAYLTCHQNLKNIFDHISFKDKQAEGVANFYSIDDYNNDDDDDDDDDNDEHNCIKNMLFEKSKKLLPILSWLPKYQFKQKILLDIVAGLTLAIVGVPQALAYALLADMPSAYLGLYTILFSPLAYILLGTSKHLAIGPLSVPSLLIASTLSNLDLETDQEYIDNAILMSLICGCFYLLLSILRLGFLSDFLGLPTLKGFTCGVVTITLFSISKDILGIHPEKGTNIIEIISYTIEEIKKVHWPSFILGTVTLFILIIMKFIPKIKKLPNFLFVVILSLIVVWSSRIDKKYDIETVGVIPKKIPTPSLPKITDNFSSLIVDSIIIAIIGFIESISVAKELGVKNNYKIYPNQELLALGSCNIIGSCFSSFPVMGSFSKSALNDNAKASSQISQLISTIFVLFTILVIAPLLEVLPKPVLGALIMVAVSKLIDVKTIYNFYKIDTLDFIICIVTLLCTLLLGIHYGISISVGLSILLYVYRGTKIKITRLGHLEGTSVYKNKKYFDVKEIRDTDILQFNSPLFFANAPAFENAIMNSTKNNLVIDFGNIPHIDSTSINTIYKVSERLKKENRQFYFVNISNKLFRYFKKIGLIKDIGKDHFKEDIHMAIATIIMNMT